MQKKQSCSSLDIQPAIKPSSTKSCATESKKSEYPLSATIPQIKGKTTTHVTIKYDVGYANTLYLRGEGANLRWDKGIPLTNVSANEWIWETNLPFNTCEFKVLINDKQYEQGENHSVKCGAKLAYSPNF